MNTQKIKQAIKLLQEAINDTDLQLEDHNFRVNSDGWEKITVDDEMYFVNPTNDIWEILEGDCKGEQLFTWDSAVRETEKAGKRMPTDEEFEKLLKTIDDMPNLVFSGYRSTVGSFLNRGANAVFWSSTQSSTRAWNRILNSTYATVYRNAYPKAFGFSVRVIKD